MQEFQLYVIRAQVRFPLDLSNYQQTQAKNLTCWLCSGNFFAFLGPWKSTNRIRKIFFGWPVACRPYGRCLHQSRATTFRRHACIEHSLATLLVRLCHLYPADYRLGAASLEAEIGGQSVTWLAPHQFAQDGCVVVDISTTHYRLGCSGLKWFKWVCVCSVCWTLAF